MYTVDYLVDLGPASVYRSIVSTQIVLLLVEIRPFVESSARTAFLEILPTQRPRISVRQCLRI